MPWLLILRFEKKDIQNVVVGSGYVWREFSVFELGMKGEGAILGLVLLNGVSETLENGRCGMT